MSPLELLATLAALIYIALTIGEHRISWLISIISSLLYIFVFWRANLYYQSVLQVFFVCSAIYGWRAWDPEKERVLEIGRLSLTQNMKWLLGSILLSVLAKFLLASFSNSPSPTLDATTTIFSVAATFLAANKKIESWYYWIIINVLSVWLFASQALYLTAVVYAAFGVLAVLGLRAWGRKSSEFSMPS